MPSRASYVSQFINSTTDSIDYTALKRNLDCSLSASPSSSSSSSPPSPSPRPRSPACDESKGLRQMSSFMTQLGFAPFPAHVVQTKLPEATGVLLDMAASKLCHELSRCQTVIEELQSASKRAERDALCRQSRIEELEREVEALRGHTDTGGAEMCAMAEQLQQQRDATARVEEELAIAKLQLLATPSAACARSRMPTRARIAYDKSVHRLGLGRLDYMGRECKEMVKQCCLRLDLEEIEMLPDIVGDLYLLVHAIFPLYGCLLSVSSLLRIDHVSCDDILARLRLVLDELRSSKAVRDTVDGIAACLDVGVDGDADYAEVGRRCSEEIRKLRSSAAADRSGEAECKWVQHFKNLFNVRSIDEMYNKANELYVMSAEVKVFCTRIKQALKLPDALSISSVLSKAVEYITMKKYDNSNVYSTDKLSPSLSLYFRPDEGSNM